MQHFKRSSSVLLSYQVIQRTPVFLLNNVYLGDINRSVMHPTISALNLLVRNLNLAYIQTIIPELAKQCSRVEAGVCMDGFHFCGMMRLSAVGIRLEHAPSNSVWAGWKAFRFLL